MSNTIKKCRSCGSKHLAKFLDLGETALANRFLTNEQLQEDEPIFPLEVVFCEECALVQILETVPPEVLFTPDYIYFSSFLPALLEHSKKNVLEIIKDRGLDGASYIIEIASNDGYLLKNYVENGIEVLGIDPATECTQAAIDAGVPSLNEFFTTELAERLKSEGKKADVIHANNVLAHVEDTNGFVQGIKTLLKEDGVAVIEVPYVRELIDHCEFDTIYHEHLCYFSVTALDKLFRKNGLFLNDLKQLSIHGGSLRLFVQRNENISVTVKNMLNEEKELGLDSFDYYQNFAYKVNKLKIQLFKLLKKLKAEGKTIAAYGAAAKGSTMINFVDIGTDLVDFVVDRNIYKHNMVMPGKHIPIVAPEQLVEQQPDYVLVLAWNFIDEIARQQSEYTDKGGRFILPVPEPKIV